MTQVRFAPAPATHRQRVQTAIERARQRAPHDASTGDAATPGEAVAARYLAGVAALGDRDGARVLQLLHDDSRRVRGIAICAAPLACDDAQATEALRVAWSVRGERRLLRRMARAGRTVAIDGFLDGLAADAQLRELVDDLPFGSPAAVHRHLAHGLERPTRRFWDGLALGHPAVLADQLLARWRAMTGEADPVTRQLTERHHARLAERAPDAALALAELLLARGIEPARPVWTMLLRERPADTVALAIRHAARVPAGALARAGAGVARADHAPRARAARAASRARAAGPDAVARSPARAGRGLAGGRRAVPDPRRLPAARAAGDRRARPGLRGVEPRRARPRWRDPVDAGRGAADRARGARGRAPGPRAHRARHPTGPPAPGSCAVLAVGRARARAARSPRPPRRRDARDRDRRAGRQPGGVPRRPGGGRSRARARDRAQVRAGPGARRDAGGARDLAAPGVARGAPADRRADRARRARCLGPLGAERGVDAAPRGPPTGKTRWVLPFDDEFFRWRPAQVERYARALEAIVGDHQRDTPAVIATHTTWPRMEYATMDRLCACAIDPRPVVREKAIRVLARCDAGQGVPILLACLGDDRARFAIYGLRRALFAMPPDRALALLADAPLRKVTVAKEVVRLTGELRAAGAFARLGELAASQLHRDVRMAVLRALWDHLDREAAWTILERAVDDPDWVVASRLADIPADRLTARLDTRLGGLLARLLARPEPEARIGLLQRASSLALVDRERVVLAAIRARLGSPYDDEVRAAMAAVLARSTEDDVAVLGASLDALRADPRALHVAAAALCGHAIRTRASWRHAAAALVEVALRDPRWSVIAIQAAAARAIAPDLVATLERATLDLDAMQAACSTLIRLDDETLEATVAALVASPRAGVRRLAVAGLAHDARPGRGWTPPRLAQLARLRADPSPEVAGAAARLWPPREDDPGWG